MNDDQAETDARIDLAYALASYFTKHPISGLSIEQRMLNLIRVSNGEMERLIAEVDYWLELMATAKKQGARP